MPARVAGGAAEAMPGGGVVLTAIKEMAAQTAAAQQVIGQFGGCFRLGINRDGVDTADRPAAVTGAKMLIVLQRQMLALLAGLHFSFMATAAAFLPMAGGGWPGNHPIMGCLLIRRWAKTAMAGATSQGVIFIQIYGVAGFTVLR